MSTQARQKSQEMRRTREAEAQRRKKRQQLFTVIGAAVIVALIAAIVFLIAKAATSGNDSGGGGDASSAVTPKNATSDGGVMVGPADAPVTVTIFYDYMCPACGAFEKANSDELDKLLADKTINVDLRPISFLDKASQGTEYSTRAANDFWTVVDAAPDKAWAFHEALYANQPEENSPGLTDDKLAEIARGAGVPDAVVAKFGDKTYEGYVAKVTQKAFDSGVTGTPTIKIDGKPFEGNPYETGPLTDAINAAAEQK